LNKLFVKWEDNPEFYFENVFASRALTLSGAATCTQAESDLPLYSGFENDATRICIRGDATWKQSYLVQTKFEKYASS
jgi:hypothetical protein